MKVTQATNRTRTQQLVIQLKDGAKHEFPPADWERVYTDQRGSVVVELRNDQILGWNKNKGPEALLEGGAAIQSTPGCAAQIFDGDFAACTKWLEDQTGFDLRDLEGNDGNVVNFKRILTTTRVILTTIDKGDEFEIVICCTNDQGDTTYLEHANF